MSFLSQRKSLTQLYMALYLKKMRIFLVICQRIKLTSLNFLKQKKTLAIYVRLKVLLERSICASILSGSQNNPSKQERLTFALKKPGFWKERSLHHRSTWWLTQTWWTTCSSRISRALSTWWLSQLLEAFSRDSSLPRYLSPWDLNSSKCYSRVFPWLHSTHPMSAQWAGKSFTV